MTPKMEATITMSAERALEQLRQWDKEGLFQPKFNNKEGTDEYQCLYADLLKALSQNLNLPSNIQCAQMLGQASKVTLWATYIQFVKDVTRAKRSTRHSFLGAMLNTMKLLKGQPVTTTLCSLALQTHIAHRINTAYIRRENIRDNMKGVQVEKLQEEISKFETTLAKKRDELEKQQTQV